jgi:hypothetical protein
MVNSNLKQDIHAEIYEECRLLICDTVHKFIRRYGGEYDELFANANTLYMQARQNYASDRGTKFSTWLRYYVWKNLLEELRHNVSRNKRLPRVSVELTTCSVKAPVEYDTEILLKRVSPEAAQVLRLILDAPSEVREAIAAKGDQPRNWRSMLRSTLKDLGWTLDQIEDSFAEIWRALK